MSQAIVETNLIPRQTIEELATRVREENGIAATVPVDPFALATQLGITVRAFKFYDPALSGMLIRRPDLKEILVRSGDPPARQGFTVAHELGHFFLHQNIEEFVDGEANLYRQDFSGDRDETASDNRRREIQANMFAASLLMPEEQVRAAWRTEKSVKRLAWLFEVSQTAMQYRIDQLRLW